MKSEQHPVSSETGGFVRLVAGFVFLLSGLVLAGWVLDLAFLKSVLPGQVSMKVNAALGFALAAFALVWARPDAGAAWRRRIASGCALAINLLGAATLIEYLLKVDLRIDQFVFRDSLDAIATSSPGRMAPLTAVDFVLLGAALVLVKRLKTLGAAQVLALLVVLEALFSLTGYVYQISNF